MRNSYNAQLYMSLCIVSICSMQRQYNQRNIFAQSNPDVHYNFPRQKNRFWNYRSTFLSIKGILKLYLSGACC